MQKRVLMLVALSLILSSCAADNNVKRESTTSAAVETSIMPQSSADYEIYESAGITYHIPASWKEVHTDKEPAKYRKFNAGDFSFSMQTFDNYYNLSKSTNQLIADTEKYFSKANCSELYIDKINGIDCIFFTLREKNTPDDKIYKIACQSPNCVVYFNFYDSADENYLKTLRDDFARTISGNISFPTETTDTTTVTTDITTVPTDTTTVTTDTTTQADTTTTRTEAITTVEDIGNSNALRAAKDYLSIMAFSYTGLINQLEYEGYSHADAKYAADNCGANWAEQAAKKAQDYIDTMPFSRDKLIEQLEYEGFTAEQAAYGASAVGY